MGRAGVGEDIVLVSLKKKYSKPGSSHKSPNSIASTWVSVAVRRRSKPNFSYSLRSFLLDPVGSLKTLMASAMALLLCSSQKILLLGYFGALVDLFPVIYC